MGGKRGYALEDAHYLTLYWLWAPQDCDTAGQKPTVWDPQRIWAVATTYSVSLTFCLLLSQLLPPYWHLKCMTNQLVTFLKGKSIKKRKLWGLLPAVVYDWHLGQLTWYTITWYYQPLTSQTGRLDGVAAICMSCRTEKTEYFIRANEKDYT